MLAQASMHEPEKHAALVDKYTGDKLFKEQGHALAFAHEFVFDILNDVLALFVVVYVS